MAATTPRSTSTTSADASSNGARSADQIEADIVATRTRLAGTIDEISDRVSPKNVLARVQERLKAQVIDPQTGLRVERVGAVAGVVVLIVTIRAVRAWRARR